jgi:hypothetical protein
MNRVIAFACADDPLDFSVFLPPQSPAAADPDSPEPDLDDVLLSLPHPDSTRALVAITPSAAQDRFAFTKLLQITGRRWAPGGNAHPPDFVASSRPIAARE